MPRVYVPTSLRSYTKNRAVVEVSGATLEALTRELDRRFPGMRFRMVDEQDRIRPHIKVFINEVQVPDLAAALGPQDEVSIVQAFSGG